MRLLRAATGPAITGLGATIIIVAHQAGYVLPIPFPGTILLIVVFLTSYFSGPAAGFTASAITLGAAVIYLSEPGALGIIPPDRLLRMKVVTVMSVVLPVVATVIRAWAQRRIAAAQAARERAEAANRELMVLRAALDEVDHGVVLLDSDLRTRFMNRAARRTWKHLDGKPTDFAELIRRADVRGIYGEADLRAEARLARRVDEVRAGDERPVDLVLNDGTILRCQCKVLPENRRFLSYTDVTDLVRHAERLETLAMTDEMTGLHNRRQFLALAEREWRRHEASGRPLSLLMFDIDHFKSINDKFGHAVGDTVIHAVADIARGEQLDGDILARIGGEEFVLLLPDIGIERAAKRAEQLRRHIGESPAGITVSFGVATAGPGLKCIGDLTNAADQALYAAKRGGRNRVETAPIGQTAAA